MFLDSELQASEDICSLSTNNISFCTKKSQASLNLSIEANISLLNKGEANVCILERVVRCREHFKSPITENSYAKGFKINSTKLSEASNEHNDLDDCRTELFSFPQKYLYICAIQQTRITPSILSTYVRSYEKNTNFFSCTKNITW